MLTAYITDLFAHAASNIHALLLYLPSGVRWLLGGWVIALLLVRATESRGGLWLLDKAARLYSRHRQWWTTVPKDASRVRLSDLRADSERAPDERVAQPARVRLVDLPADFLDRGEWPRGQVGWRCRYCGQGRVFEGTVEQEAREATDHEARCAHRHDTFTVAATEPVSLVEPDVRVCAECGAPVEPMDDLLRGLFEPESQVTGWKPGMPPWGTAPLAAEMNHAQARRFRQMISDAIRRQQAS